MAAARSTCRPAPPPCQQPKGHTLTPDTPPPRDPRRPGRYPVIRNTPARRQAGHAELFRNL